MSSILYTMYIVIAIPKHIPDIVINANPIIVPKMIAIVVVKVVSKMLIINSMWCSPYVS